MVDPTNLKPRSMRSLLSASVVVVLDVEIRLWPAAAFDLDCHSTALSDDERSSGLSSWPGAAITALLKYNCAPRIVERHHEIPQEAVADDEVVLPVRALELTWRDNHER